MKSNMQERGINSTFKKIIYESSEMVFLADDTYPYTIFYGNELFEKEIGDNLEQRNLVGLGLDVNSYIFKEELLLPVNGKEYAFALELPHENESNYYLFYRGKQLDGSDSPSRQEAIGFFQASQQLIGVGEYHLLTFVNALGLQTLGYKPHEILHVDLAGLIHPDDRTEFSAAWAKGKQLNKPFSISFRIQSKAGTFLSLDASFSFIEERFFVTAKESDPEPKEKAIRKLQLDLLNSTTEVKPVGYWIYKPKTHKISLDQFSADLLGTSKSLKLDSKKTPKVLRNSFKKVIKEVSAMNGPSAESELSFEVREKQTVKIKAAKGWDNGIEVIYGLIYDQSDYLQREEENSFFKSLFMEAPEAMFLVKDTGDILIINTEARKLFEVTESNLPAHLDDFSSKVIDQESPLDWIKPIEEFDNERFTRFVNQKNQKMTLAIRSKVIECQKEKFIAISFRNITEKVSLEKSLEENTEFLMNLTDQVPGGLYQMVLSKEGEMKFAFLSKGIGAVLGLESAEIRNLKDIGLAMANVHPSDLPQVVMTSVASAQKLEPWQCQFRVKTGNQDKFKWVMGAARPQRLESGEMVWYGYLADISQQKEIETKLDEARYAAEKANQIKSDFLSMISHELRTPLNAISGSVYSLLQESPSDYQKNALNTINFAVDNLIIMINDLLDFQKIEAGKLHIEHAPFNLEELLNQIIKGLTFHARDSKNKLKLDLAPELDLVVKGDKTRISQILNNLITNALKFTQKGVVAVKVDLVNKERDKVRLYFEVQDNGIGIAPEHQEKIFEDFDQVKPTFSKKYGGTGLGLSITKKLLGIMGSQIRLESEEGKGSKFFFELELEVAENQDSSIGTDRAKSTVSTALHMLMAEDNEVNALVLGKIITKWGYTYDRVMNGMEAVEAMSSGQQYDCVLMDIQMPVMNGFEATLQIKNNFDIPVIALTAAAKLEIMEQIKECGFDGFVAKPIDAAELHSVIKDVVQRFQSKA
ncbi:ATP-binding protein [Algoriphagus namhaensis]